MEKTCEREKPDCKNRRGMGRCLIRRKELLSLTTELEEGGGCSTRKEKEG